MSIQNELKKRTMDNRPRKIPWYLCGKDKRKQEKMNWDNKLIRFTVCHEYVENEKFNFIR